LSPIFFSDKIAFGECLSRRDLSRREQLPRAYDAVYRLTQKIGLPMPKLYVIPRNRPNAFATGRNPKTCFGAVTHGHFEFNVLISYETKLEGVAGARAGTCGEPRHLNQFNCCDPSPERITYLAHIARWE